MSLIPNCHEASRLLSEDQDHRLPATDRARLRLHLVLCDACRNVEQQLAFLRRALRGIGSEREDRPDS